MAVVGSAYVIVRAISKSLAKDIKKGVSDAVKGSLPDIDKATAGIADKVGENVKKDMAKVGKDVAPVAHAAGRDIQMEMGRGFDDLGKTVSKKVNESVKKSGIDALPSAKLASANVANAFGGDFGPNLNKAIRGKMNDAVHVEGRHLLPEAKAIGRDFADSLAESFTVEIPAQIRRKRNVIDRAVGRALSGAWKQVRADQGGRDIGNRFVKGFTKSMDKFKIPAKFWLAFFALPALGGALKILAAYVASAISIVSALGPALGAAGVAGAAGIASLIGVFGVFKLAFRNFKKSDLAVVDKFKDGLKESSKALDKLQTAVATKLFPQLLVAQKLGIKLLETIKPGLVGVAQATGEMAVNLAKTLNSKGNLESINGILKGTPAVLKPLGAALGSIVTIFLDLAQAGQPALVQFLNFVAAWLKGKQAALDAAEASGRLGKSIGKMVGVAKQVGRITGNVFRGLGGVFKAAYGSGQSFLGSIEQMTKKFDKFVNSDYGQTKLKTFFNESREIVREVNGLIGDILKALGQPISQSKGSDNIVTFVRTLRTDVLPVIQDLAKEAGKLAPKLVPLFKSVTELIKSMNEQGALGSFFDTLGKIIDVITKLFKMPVVGDILGWVLAFGGMYKAVNFVLKPIGGLKTILGPLGKLLFGTKEKAGLLTKAFEGLSKTKVGGFFRGIRTGVGSIGSKLWTGAATAVRRGVGGVLRAIGGLAVGLARAVGNMLLGAAKLIPWGNLFKGGAAKVGLEGTKIGGWLAAGLGKSKWSGLFKGIGGKILGPLGAAITITDIGHALMPTVDRIAQWVMTKLPEPVAKAFFGAYTVAMNHPILRGMREGTDQLFDNIWPDRFPWEDPIPPPNFTAVKTELAATGRAIGTAVASLGQAVQPLVVTWKLAWDRLNKETGGALGAVATAITTKGAQIIANGRTLANGLVNGLKGIFNGARPGITQAAGNMVGGILGIVKMTITPVTPATKAVMDATARVITGARAAMNTAARTATSAVTPTVKTAISGLRAAGTGGFGNFASGIRQQTNVVRGAARTAAQPVNPTVRAAIAALHGIGARGGGNFASGIRGARDLVVGAARTIAAAAKPHVPSLAATGAAAIGGFVSGMRSMIDDVARAAIAATNAVINNKGPIEYDRVMLIPAGEAVIGGFVKGLKSARRHIVDEMRDLSKSIPGMIDPRDAVLGIDVNGTASGFTRPGAGSGGTQINNWKVYNPVAEKTSQTVVRKSTRSARAGAFA